MTAAEYTTNEIMTIAAARLLKNGAVCFVGIGLPSTAANLARLTHAPDIVLIYESGPIGAKPPLLPLSIGDGNLAETFFATGCKAGVWTWDFLARRRSTNLRISIRR
jgi:glutaconate CoA-transferase subunit B